ncbi:MAG TPA: glycosyltransferase family 2 protein [Fibrobacteria bacterium]|nr:glycosyltransferase family 2 protein [Fibrobacteria bacterium]
MKPAADALSIFIPAYNAAGTLAEVIGRIPKDLWADIGTVTVIDDGSRDGTAEVAERLMAAFPKLRLHRFERNQGYGRAVRRGLGFCRESGSEFCACLHADGQYPPEKLVQFLEHMRRHRVDVLQGSRHLHGTARAGGMPLYKIAAGRILTWMENLCFGLAMTDYHSGFLMYSRKALRSIPFERLSGYFDFDLEVIATARALGLHISELGIPTRYADEKSHLNPIKYGLRTLRVMARYRLGRYAAAAPEPGRAP